MFFFKNKHVLLKLKRVMFININLPFLRLVDKFLSFLKLTSTFKQFIIAK